MILTKRHSDNLSIKLSDYEEKSITTLYIMNNLIRNVFKIICFQFKL